MHILRFFSLLLTINLVQIPIALSLTEGNLEREQHWYEEIIDTIVDGDPIDLQSKNQSFLGLLTEVDNAQGAVLLLHGRGLHPNWEDVIYPLRTGLVVEGWTTLSLQMPILEGGATYYDYIPLFDAAAERIEAGIQYLNNLGIDNIVLLTHSCGVHMGMHRIDDLGTMGISAFVGIGMGATDYGQTLSKPYPLQSMSIPILDLYGEHDFNAVKSHAPDRRTRSILAGNNKYKQIELHGANHYFSGRDDQLTKTVISWLNTL